MRNEQNIRAYLILKFVVGWGTVKPLRLNCSS